MSAALKLSLFALALAVVFVLSLALGSVVDSEGPATSGPVPMDHNR